MSTNSKEIFTRGELNNLAVVLGVLQSWVSFLVEVLQAADLDLTHSISDDQVIVLL